MSSSATAPDAEPSPGGFDAQPDLDAQRAWFKSTGIHVPYFNVHEGVAGAHTQIGNRDLINFASYNYAGLCGDADVAAAAKAAIDRYGTSVSASRIVSGERPIHRELEQALAGFLGTADALTFVSGHGTNVTAIGELVGRDDLVVHDAYIHNSAQLGCRLSGARRMSFPHNDPAALDRLLRRHRAQYRRALVLLEGVYSMDGDIPDLPAILEIKRRYEAKVMIDEAHSTGVLGATGRGLAEHFGLAPGEVDLWMGTLSKVFASCGGYLAGPSALIERLRFFTPGVMFSVGLPPPAAAAALAALRKLAAEPGRVTRLRERAELFRTLARHRGWKIGPGAGSAVVPLILGDSDRTLRLADGLYRAGINVPPIVFPAIRQDQARLRFFFCADHSEDDIRHTVDVIAGLWPTL